VCGFDLEKKPPTPQKKSLNYVDRRYCNTMENSIINYIIFINVENFKMPFISSRKIIVCGGNKKGKKIFKFLEYSSFFKYEILFFKIKYVLI
jgi:hypothetical protein